MQHLSKQQELPQLWPWRCLASSQACEGWKRSKLISLVQIFQHQHFILTLALVNWKKKHKTWQPQSCRYLVMGQTWWVWSQTWPSCQAPQRWSWPPPQQASRQSGPPVLPDTFSPIPIKLFVDVWFLIDLEQGHVTATSALAVNLWNGLSKRYNVFSFSQKDIIGERNYETIGKWPNSPPWCLLLLQSPLESIQRWSGGISSCLQLSCF